MARHTIVVELPEGADAADVELLLTARINLTSVKTGVDRVQQYDVGYKYGNLRVVEYHHEQMTTTEKQT